MMDPEHERIDNENETGQTKEEPKDEQELESEQELDKEQEKEQENKEEQELEKEHSPKKEEKRVLKNKTVFLVIAAIILFFVIFFAVRHFMQPDDYNPFELPEGEEELSYNGFRFVKIEGLWYTQWQREENLYTIPLRFNPVDAEKVPTEGTLDVELFNKMQDIYITFDLSEEEGKNFTMLALASTELSQNLVKAIQRNPIAACTNNESDACRERPIIDCNTEGVPVILIREQSPTKVILDGGCMTLQGEGMDLLRAVDKVLYQWYGIIT